MDTLFHFFLEAVEAEASDIHLKIGKPPIYRLDGQLYTADAPPVTEAHLDALADTMLTERARATFQKNMEVDFAWNMNDQTRFREPDHNRTWDIERLNPDTGEITGVTVLQRRPNNNFEYTLTAESAFWRDGNWFFRNAVLQHHSVEGYRMGTPEARDLLPMPTFTESPARMVRENKQFQYLTSREIRAYLDDRESVSPKTRAVLMTEIHMRQAHPWLCLVTMLMAVPFGSHTARKGVFLGVAMSLLLFFSLFFCMNLFKAMGQGLKISPWLAGWTPTLLFGAIGTALIRKLR
jgi:lipopolysaccharide export LptBFGC system permease protein LptF